ncbi:hypothetical protein ACKGJO_05720 [Gracilimonas sp. Q87]|uniref:hypothetical protein n=1 Tax=Gracilimonas sp. Q87 TaxID=3384766 RepID=UPI00398401F0
MSGYSEVLYVIFAMVIVATMALNANRVIQVNNVSMIEGQLEGQVISYAQNIIEEARALAFDQETTDDPTSENSVVPVTIPEGFTNDSNLGIDSGETQNDRTTYNDFDDYNEHSETVTFNGVDYIINVTVDYISHDNTYTTFTITNSETTLKRITVNVQSEFLNKNPGSDNTNYNFSFIRSYYAD